MVKRSYVEIERDYKIIKEFVDKNPSISSYNEIMENTGLSKSQIVTSLSNHPRVFKRIKEIMANNHGDIKISQNDSVNNNHLNITKKVVIDASITGYQDFDNLINEILTNKNKIVLTSITIRELEKLQKFSDKKALDARHILALAAENENSFSCVVIEEKESSPDNCIVSYCEKNKDNVMLLTSDKTMALNARSYGVDTRYLKKKVDFENNKKIPKRKLTSDRIATLYDVEKKGVNLFISKFKTQNKVIRIVTDNQEYSDGVHKLNVGDDIYILKKKEGYFTFVNFRLISTMLEDNVEVIFSKRIYSREDINNIKLSNYKSFIGEFYQKI